MKAKKKTTQTCEIAGCKRKWICGVHPKGKILRRLFVCKYHLKRNHDPKDSFCFYKIWHLPKPEKIIQPKAEQKTTKKKEGKPKWQGVLDTWFEKGKYPVSKYMNPKRWQYWFSIGGKKPEGDSRKFDKQK